MPAAEVCELLDWDTEFFGFPIARLRAGRLTAEEADRAETWCRERGIVCAYFLAEADDYATLHAAGAHGFELCDVRVTFAMRLAGDGNAAAAASGLRPSRLDDVPRLRAIAAGSFHDSRFYFDPRFARERCDGLYAAWIENSVRRSADAALVADDGEGVQGFITCDVLDAGEGRIGLLAVDAAARGRGWGRRLVEGAVDWFRRRRIGTLRVATQLRNIPSQRLYQRCGFRTAEVRLWLHRWFRESPREVRP